MRTSAHLFSERNGYRNGSVSRGPKILLQTRITNPPGEGLQRWRYRVRVRVLQAVLLTWRNGNLCTAHIYFVARTGFQGHIRFP